MTSSPDPRTPLLSIRTTVILMVGGLLGAVVGTLTAIGRQHVALAVAFGIGAAGSSIATLHKLIGS